MFNEKILLVSALAIKTKFENLILLKKKLLRQNLAKKVVLLKELKVVLSCNNNTLTPQMH